MSLLRSARAYPQRRLYVSDARATLQSMYDVNFFSVLAAGIVAALIGYIWYHPRLFGAAWMRMSNITPETAERGKRHRSLTALLGILASMLVAYVMGSFGAALHISGFVGAVELGFWCWSGFAVPVLLGQVLWEHKPLKLFLINALYWLVAFVAMALTLLL